MASVWGELKRRNVVRVAIAYAIVSWLILQLTDVLMPLLSLPEWVGGLVFLLLVVGFLLALILSWAYELTPEGVKKEKEVDRSESITPVTGRKLDFFIIAALTIALAFVVVDQYVLEESPPPAPVEVSESLRYIAVLPFTNRSAEEENAAFLADGIHDDLLTRLSKIGDLKVISRTSVMEYRDTTKNMRQIGEELGVGSILEGGVQRIGDAVRINVQLINAQTDEHLWAETYDKELTATNLFAIQSEISTAIANALHATLSPDEQQRVAAVLTENLEALEAYFTGIHTSRGNLDSPRNAIESFERAVALDPEFARAYAELARAWMILPFDSLVANPTRVRAEAAAAAQKAIDLEPDSPDALAMLATLKLRHSYDWQGAERLFRHALDIESTNATALHWYSHLLSWQGKHAEAIEMSKQAIGGNPLSSQYKGHRIYVYGEARRWDEAFSLGEKMLRQHRGPTIMRIMWRVQLWARRADDAAVMFKDWAVSTGRSADAADELGAAFIQFQQTDTPVEVSDALIERLRIGDVDLPQVYASVGDKEKTIAALQQSHLRRTGSANLLNMKTNPSYDFIRDDPRFIELLKQIGLAD